MFDPEQMKPGDVMLEKGDGWTSKAIMMGDGGGYSHALIYVGESSFVEAVPSAVRIITSTRVLIDDPSRWTVLRLVDDAHAGEIAARQARMMVHAKYSVKGALGSVVPFATNARDGGIFCSRLVAEAYARAGVNLVDGIDAAKVTPAGLQFSSRFTELAPPLMEVPADERETLTEHLDRDAKYVGSPRHRELVVSQRIFRKLHKGIRKLAKPETPNLPFPPRNLNELLNILGSDTSPTASHIADRIMREFEATDYFSLWHAPLREVRNTIAEEVKRSRDPEDRRAIQRTLAPDDTRARQERNRHTLASYYAATRHPIWLMLIEAHMETERILADIAGLTAKIGVENP